jgi:hypothetical protein
LKPVPIILTILALSACLIAPRAQGAPLQQIHAVRLEAQIKVDGDLSDPGWRDAARVDLPYEINRTDNGTPPVRTTGLVAYDSKYLYVALLCEDPDPKKIRAPLTDRDGVGSDQDFAGIFLDTRHDGRSALELFVNPRGAQSDGVTNDATGQEDFSPDIFWDSAARITGRGWEMEMRLPLTSLRYPKADPQTWGIIFYRNYPRDFRYQITSVPVPKGNNCLVCHEMDLSGLTGLPSSNHLVVAPYVTAKEVGQAEFAPGTPFVNGPVEGNGGADVKWTPTPDTALDITINPDFSQVESDVVQLAVNQRFALFYPEKRPFFMEGVDLFQTPIDAVYTRTITSPRWGLRATGKAGSMSYTVLTTQDRGGGLIIVPGPESSTYAPQDFGSLVTIGRVRWDVGRSFWGFLVTDREDEGGSFNRVFGPDFQWRPSDVDQVTGQYLYSSTKTPDTPDLAPEWDGRKLEGGDLYVVYDHSAKTWRWNFQYRDVSPEFRANSGYVPQVGYQEGRGRLSYNFYPNSFFSRIEPAVIADMKWLPGGQPLSKQYYAGANFEGRKGLYAELFYNQDTERVGNKLLTANTVFADANLSPSAVFSRVSLSAVVGQAIDYEGARVGHGGDVTIAGTFRPTDHLTAYASAERSWLNLPEGNLYTADTYYLKATYNFSARSFLRLIAQWLETRRNPALYDYPVPEKVGGLTGSVLFAYKLNWQSVLYVGYGDDRLLTQRRGLQPAQRNFFLKVSYAFQ